MNILNLYCINDEESNIGDMATSIAIKQLLGSAIKIDKFYEVDLRSLRGEGAFGATHTPLELKDIILDVDFCVVGGGGLYSRSFFPLDDDLLNLLSDVPIILYGLGYNRNLEYAFLNEEQKSSIRKLNEMSVHSSVRDKRTLELLEELDQRSICIGDPAICLKGIGSDLPASISSSKKIKIGVNLAFHGWTNQDKYIDNILAEVIKSMEFFKKSEKAEFVYIKHAAGEQHVIDRMLSQGISLTVVDYGYDSDSPQKTKSAYGHLDMFIGMMLHSTIFAFSENVPMINIGYDEKNLAFMQLIKQDKFYVGYEKVSANELIKMGQEILDKRSVIKHQLSNHLDEFQHKHHEFCRRIVEELK